MLSKKVADLLNNQVNKELYSAYLYLDFENYYHDKSLEGFANWYHVQVQEEIAHAQLMMQYLQDNDYSVVLEAINKPNISLNELSDPLKAGLKHEQYVTELIHTCYAAAYEEKDFRITSVQRQSIIWIDFFHSFFIAVLGLVCQRTRRRRKKCFRFNFSI